MGKAAMCMMMLKILSTGGVYKISELAEILETNPRNILEYKKELEECGYYINTITGKYGGYELDSRNLLPNLEFTKDEKEAINESYKFLNTKESFLNKPAYESAMGKIMSSYDNTNVNITPLIIIEKDGITYDRKTIENSYNIIKKSIEKRLSCEIEYLSNSNKIQKRTINPYELYIYNENWFVIAECKELNQFSHFKLSRIQLVLETKNHFYRDPYFKKSEYIDSQGFKKNSEWFDVKLEVKGYFIIKLKEKIVGKNQTLEMIDKNTAIFSATMQYRFNIISFVMSMGSLCKVIEPSWLQEEVVKISYEMLEKYKK